MLLGVFRAKVLPLFLSFGFFSILAGCDTSVQQSDGIDRDTKTRFSEIEEGLDHSVHQDHESDQGNKEVIESDFTIAAEAYKKQLRERKERSLEIEFAEAESRLTSSYLGSDKLLFHFFGEEVDCNGVSVRDLKPKVCFSLGDTTSLGSEDVVSSKAKSRLISLLSHLNFISFFEATDENGVAIIAVHSADLSDAIRVSPDTMIISIPVFEIRSFKRVSSESRSENCSRALVFELEVLPLNSWGADYLSAYGGNVGYFCAIAFENLIDVGPLIAGNLL